MTKSAFNILIVFGLVLITSSVIGLLVPQVQDEATNAAIGSRANNPPVLRPGITNPYIYTVKEDADVVCNLTQSVFQDPNNDPITCDFIGIPSGVYICYAFEAWIEDQTLLHIKTYRDKYLDAYQDINVSCSDGQDSAYCLFKINVSNIGDKSLSFDEDTTNDVSLPTTVFPSVGFTIISCSIDEAVMGTFSCHLFDATIVSTTTLHLVMKKDKIGTVEFNVSCTNGTVTSTCELHVTVNNVNDDPAWSYIQQTLPRVGDPYYITVGSTIEFPVIQDRFQQYKLVATDVDNDPLTISTNATNPRFHLNETSWEFNFTPSQEDIGLRTIKKMVTFYFYIHDVSPSIAANTTSIRFEVANINDHPTNGNFTIQYIEGDIYNVTFVANPGIDPDGDDLTYIWNFGDETEDEETTQLTIKHRFPWAYSTKNYNVSLRVKDSQDYSERIYQVVSIVRPIVNASELVVLAGMKGNLDLDVVISKCTVSDLGVESEAYAKINRTITMQGTCHASTTVVYIYESIGVLQGESYQFSPFTLSKNRFGNDMIFPPVETDWDLRISRALTEPSVGYVAENYKFRFAVVVWSIYGYDVAFADATYESKIIAMDSPQEFPIKDNVKGTSDFTITLSSASVVDTTKTKAKEVHNVTRSINMAGTCDPGVVQIYFYEDDGSGWVPLIDETGNMLGVKPSGSSWSFSGSVSREIAVSDTNKTRNIKYCAVAWNHTDYNTAYATATYKQVENIDEPLVSTQIIVFIVVAFIIILILVVVIVGVIMFKRWDEKKKAELSKVAKKEDEEAQGAPGQPLPPGQVPPGQPGQAGPQKDDYMKGPQYAPTPVNKQKVEVDASYAAMFASDGTEKPAEPEISPDKQTLTFDAMTIENPVQSESAVPGTRQGLAPPPPAHK